MASKLTVHVTADDIEKARVHKERKGLKPGEGDSFECVVSQAIARQLPEAHRIETDYQTIRFTLGGERHVYLTPYQVQGYVIAFDDGAPLEPFKFQLRDDRRVTVRRKLRTDIGKAALKARRDAIGNAAKKAAGDEISSGAHETRAPDETPVESPAEAGRKAYATVRAEGTGPTTQVTDPTLPKAPPRMSRGKRREYGMRTMRINQAKAANA